MSKEGNATNFKTAQLRIVEQAEIVKKACASVLALEKTQMEEMENAMNVFAEIVKLQRQGSVSLEQSSEAIALWNHIKLDRIFNEDFSPRYSPEQLYRSARDEANVQQSREKNVEPSSTPNSQEHVETDPTLNCVPSAHMMIRETKEVDEAGTKQQPVEENIQLSLPSSSRESLEMDPNMIYVPSSFSDEQQTPEKNIESFRTLESSKFETTDPTFPYDLRVLYPPKTEDPDLDDEFGVEQQPVAENIQLSLPGSSRESLEMDPNMIYVPSFSSTIDEWKSLVNVKVEQQTPEKNMDSLRTQEPSKFETTDPTFPYGLRVLYPPKTEEPDLNDEFGVEQQPVAENIQLSLPGSSRESLEMYPNMIYVPSFSSTIDEWKSFVNVKVEQQTPEKNMDSFRTQEPSKFETTDPTFPYGLRVLYPPKTEEPDLNDEFGVEQQPVAENIQLSLPGSSRESLEMDPNMVYVPSLSSTTDEGKLFIDVKVEQQTSRKNTESFPTLESSTVETADPVFPYCLRVLYSPKTEEPDLDDEFGIEKQAAEKGAQFFPKGNNSREHVGTETTTDCVPTRFGSTGEMKLVDKVSTEVYSKVEKDPMMMLKTFMQTITGSSRTSTFSLRVETRLRTPSCEYKADKTTSSHVPGSDGASISSTRGSENCNTYSLLKQTVDIPLWNSPEGARSARKFPGKALSPGVCWSFKGSVGYLSQAYSLPMRITVVTYEHIRANQVPGRERRSAPKTFKVWAYKIESDLSTRILLGNFTYDINDDPVQLFVAPSPPDYPVRVLEMEVTSNYGADHTDLYRLLTHGLLYKPAENKDRREANWRRYLDFDREAPEEVEPTSKAPRNAKSTARAPRKAVATTRVPRKVKPTAKTPRNAKHAAKAPRKAAPTTKAPSQAE